MYFDFRCWRFKNKVEHKFGFMDDLWKLVLEKVIKIKSRTIDYNRLLHFKVGKCFVLKSVISLKYISLTLFVKFPSLLA